MSGRGYAERNLPSFFANSFGTLDHFKVDCKAEELAQGQHLVISMMDTGLEKDFQTSSVLRVCYQPPTSSTSEVRLFPSPENEQNRSFDSGPRHLSPIDISRNVLTSRIPLRFLLTAV